MWENKEWKKIKRLVRPESSISKKKKEKRKLNFRKECGAEREEGHTVWPSRDSRKARAATKGPRGRGGGLLADQPPSPSCILTLCDTKKQTNGVCPVLALGTLSRSLTSGQIRRSPQRKAWNLHEGHKNYPNKPQKTFHETWKLIPKNSYKENMWQRPRTLSPKQ